MQTEPDPRGFEQVRRRYPFAPLVAIVLAIAEWIRPGRARRAWHLRDLDTDQPQST